MALQARLMSQALRKLSHSLSMSQTLLLFINQVTEILLKLVESDKGRAGQ
jgi:RecA/RadA recombinase